MIPVTKPYRPNRDKYCQYVNKIYDSAWLTNNGPLVQELEERLQKYLGVKNIILVANGSLALQIAYRVLELKGEVITSSFSFVATTSTLVWERLKPVFGDIDPKTYNLSSRNIKNLITPETCAIVPVHVFGNPCEIESIKLIAEERGLKLIYDAAHAFGVNYKGQSILNQGNISTLSLHATKLFHTIEGGAVITDDDELAEKVRLLINFGISVPDRVEGLGINAKMNEFEAAMGLCVLDEIDCVIKKRKEIWNYYETILSGYVDFQQLNPDSEWNYSYAPILFSTENELLKAKKVLNDKQIIPKRYFYPSLDTLKYLQPQKPCNTSRDIAKRILCLPLYAELSDSDIEMIVNLIRKCL